MAGFLLLAAFASGQKQVTINYTSTGTLPDTATTVFTLENIELHIQDSIAYCFYPINDTLHGLGKIPVPLGSGYWPKSLFMSNTTHIRIYQEGFWNKPRTHRLVVRKMEKVKWIITGEKKNILGYECIKATGFAEKGSVVAWYAPELPAGFGPFLLTSLPGTILEYEYDFQNIRMVATAADIQKGCLPVMEPTFCKRTKHSTIGR